MRTARRWLPAAPLLLYLAVFFAYPSASVVVLALTDSLGAGFPSFESFRALADDALFWRALCLNVVLPILSVVLELAAGLALALLLAARFPGRQLIRAIVVLPFALPEIVFLIIMRFVFAPRGYANAALALAGIEPVDWLAPAQWLTLAVVICVDAWRVTPVVFLLLLAALSAIPEEVNQAARLDGGGAWARLRWITLPLLRPALIAAVLLRGLDALRMFATPLVLAGVEGAPVLSTYAFHQWSDYGNDAVAAAAAAVLAGLCVLLSLPLLRLSMLSVQPGSSAERQPR